MEKCDISNPLRRRNRASKQRLKKRSVVMKRNAIEGKVTTLQKLVPNCESGGVEGLFRETADYIMALEMRVKVMQIVVDLLSGCDDDDDDEDEDEDEDE
ncbi:hypothetical protein ACS0TY_005175 [Phlomoides rotata]